MATAPGVQPSQQYQALYRATVQEAASTGGVLMGKLADAARTALQAREAASRDLRERDKLAESAKQLRIWEPELCKRYPAALLDAFNNPEVLKKAQSVSSSDLQFDQLELMDEAQVLTSVALARTLQAAMQSAEASLSDLNMLICTTLGLGAVRPERNPLRPEIYIHALKDVVEKTQVSSQVQLDWLGAMGVVLGQELRSLYTRLASSLRSQGVMAAGYAVVQTVASVGIGRGVAQVGESAAAAGFPAPPQVSMVPAASVPITREAASPVPEQVRVGRRDEALLTLDKLRRLLAGELDVATAVDKKQAFAQQFARQFESSGANSESAPVSEFDATVPAALEALSEMKQVDRVVQSFQQRHGSRKLPDAEGETHVEAVRAGLRRNATGVAQALSLEVVQLMVDNIAHDPRLLEPVRRLIQRLEPALLRLALVDPRFFTDKQHPARVLLQEITHRSLAYDGVEAPGFDGFVRQMDLATEPLLKATIEDAEPFVKVLALLRQSWAMMEQLKATEREQTVLTLQHAEARNLLAERIARDIDAHPDAANVPDVVIDFLCGPWAQVVAQARIAGGSGSTIAGKYQSLISALLWSAHPELAPRNVTKLTKLVPLLLSTLRDGLETIRYPATKTSAFLEALMGLHQNAFRAASRIASGVAAETLQNTNNELLHGTRGRLVDQGDPWLAPQEAQSSNFIDLTEETPQTSRPAAEPAQADSVESPREEAHAVLEKMAQAADLPIQELPLGSWVELMVNDQWTRTQLTWASPHGTLFLFTSVVGTTQSMTRRSRDKLIEGGKLRVISGQPVVEGALDAVAQIAMRNSVDTTL